METKIKIAIYDGVIPSSVFIENLIGSLSKQDVEIYLFGRLSDKTVNYPNNVKKITYPENKVGTIGFVLMQILFMLFRHPIRLKKIYLHYRFISKKEKIYFLNWCKNVLPVINNLPDIFHLQWAKALPKWFFLKDLFNVKIALSLRGAHINYSPLANKELKNIYKNLFPHVDVFHSVSNAIRNEAIKYGASDEKIKTIYSAIDLKKINIYRKKKWYSNSTFNFISVGRHHWKKGYPYALLAIKKLLEKNLDIHYTIVAKNDPSEEVLYHINDLSIKDYVSLLSMESQKEVYQKMSKSDCLLLPSVEEGIANVVLEAMAIGLPVISSNCGGMREIITDKSKGLIFKLRDTSNLVFVMNNIMNMSEREKRKMVINTRIHIEKKHDYDGLGYKMFQLYRSINNYKNKC